MTVYTSTKQISRSWIHEGRAVCLTSCEKTPWIRSLWSTRGFQKTRCANNRKDFATRLEFTKLTKYVLSLLCVEPKEMLCFLIISFSGETPTSFVSPWLDKIQNCLNFTKLPRDLRSCFAPRRNSRLEKSGHENVFENTKRRHYNPEIHCILSDNWLLHQLYFNVLAGHIPSPQPTWHE